MILTAFFNIIAFISLIIFFLGIINVFRDKFIYEKIICSQLKIIILFELLLIVLSIYLPLTLQPALEYSKYVTAPILIFFIFLSFILLFLKKLSCSILFSIISLGLIGALFRLYSSFQLDLTKLF